MAKTWRAPAKRSAEAIAGRAAQWGRSAVSVTAATDHVVQAALTTPRMSSLHDPVAAVGFLRDAWGPLQFEVTPVKPAVSLSPRVSTLIETLTDGVPALSTDDAIAMCKVADDLIGRREPFDRPRYAADVGWHAAVCSSFATKGRLLAAVVRFARTRSIIEIGTAYGMSAKFLALELPEGGRVVTVEASHPQIDVAREVLAGSPMVTSVRGFSHEVVDQVTNVLATADLLFHDGEHSRAAYIRDFELYEPLLAPGALVLLDDIHWEDDRVQAGPAQTYEGWQAICGNPRVASAWEINDQIGLLQLR